MMEKIDKGHPMSQSTDFVAQNIETLKTLFPTIVKEGKIDIKELQALLGDEIETEEEYYRFTWAGKSMARREANKPSTATLRPDKASSKDWDTTQNIFIEGDNLEVLKLLQKSYANKIKMIYIDPPYNTGKDFVYKDNYNDNLGNYLAITGQVDEDGKRVSTNSESDGRYHSNWLNMMYPRLKLARNLLTEDGIIFISIDDSEMSNLKNVCNDLFGEENFLIQLIWKSGRTASAHFTNEHEYILCFAKNKLTLPLFKFIGEDNISDRAIKRVSDKNPTSIIKFPAGIDFESEDKIFPNELGDTERIKVVKGIFESKDGKLANDVEIEAAWTMKDMIEGWIEGDEVIDQKGQIVNRFYFKSNGVLQYEKKKGTIHPKSIISDFSTKNGTSILKTLLGKPFFEFPKPPGLISYLASINTNSGDIILDFFAGSGTTAQAIMQLNSEDGESKKFICVQLPEQTDEKSEAFKAGFKTISEITKERIRRAGEKIKSELKNDLFSKEGKILDVGFRAFKLDSSNIRAWDGNPDALEENLFNSGSNIKENRTEEDVLYEILLKYGLDLTMPIEQKEIAGKKVFNIGMGALFICLGDNITTAVAEGIGKWKEEQQPATSKVIYKDTGFTDVEKTNSMQILKRFGIVEVNTI
jgi:adenine-specific DNA-methyltransferase